VNDLVDVSGTYADWGETQAALSDDLNGDAVLTAGAASLTLQGIAAAQLTEDMFLF
jgi:hypothetical protein